MPVHADCPEFQILAVSGLLDLSPADWQIEGWYDNPLNGDDDEADFAGYTPATSGWSFVLDGAEVATAAVVSLGTASADAAEAVRFWAVRHVVTGVIGYSGPLEQKVYPVDGVELVIRPRIRVATY